MEPLFCIIEFMIGIFDSGIGGMTVAKALREEMPHTSIVYFGDTAHLPYGDKSPASLRHYAARITMWLLQQKIDSLVIACNTASSLAHNLVQDICGPKIPVINVIDPVVEHVVEHISEAKIGVIGTKGTIESGVYPSKLQQANPSLNVIAKATPLLAPMIEEGYFDNSISQAVIHDYLKDEEFNNLDALILGCTHYPLIQDEVGEFFKHQVRVIDSPKIVAQRVLALLSEVGKIEDSGQATYRCCVSDFTKSFEESTRIFFSESIELEEHRIWD